MYERAFALRARARGARVDECGSTLAALHVVCIHTNMDSCCCLDACTVQYRRREMCAVAIPGDGLAEEVLVRVSDSTFGIVPHCDVRVGHSASPASTHALNNVVS